MKIRLLKKNLRVTKSSIKELAKLYKVKVKWEDNPEKPIIDLTFVRRINKMHTCILLQRLSADKIAYGKYKPGMVCYNVERKLQSWLNELPEV